MKKPSFRVSVPKFNPRPLQSIQRSRHRPLRGLPLGAQARGSEKALLFAEIVEAEFDFVKMHFPRELAGTVLQIESVPPIEAREHRDFVYMVDRVRKLVRFFRTPILYTEIADEQDRENTIRHAVHLAAWELIGEEGEPMPRWMWLLDE